MGILENFGLGHADFLAADWLPPRERAYAAGRAFDESRRRARLRRLGAGATRFGLALQGADRRRPGRACGGGEADPRRSGKAPPETSRFVGTWNEERGYRPGLPPLPRRWRAEFVRRILSCPPDSLPSPPCREGAGGLYLEGGEASLLALELRRSLGF